MNVSMVALSLAAAVSAIQLSSAQSRRFEIIEATVDDLRTAFASKQLTCRALVGQYLRRIDAYDKIGPALNAVQTINRRALDEAERLDAAFAASGPTGPLHCVPVLLKDQVETSDMPTTYGSAVFRDFVPHRDATIVTRLKKAGAIIIAKATMGEFASGFLGSAFGAVRNAYDPARSASGSSGGTGSGIAANFATVGIGEDTGGSIRGPAAVGNLVGLRPTLPLVSRFGMMPARPTTDTLGPIARSVKDAAIILDVIAGYDLNDPVTAHASGRTPSGSYAQFLSADGLKGARIGVIREPMDPRADPASADYKQVRTVIDRALTDLTRLGATLVDPISIHDLASRSVKLYDGNVFETEVATNTYLAQHPNAPVKSLVDILLSGKVVPARARALMAVVGRSTDEAGYLQLMKMKEDLRLTVLGAMADQHLDALVYATFDHSPIRIPDDALTRQTVDSTGPGNNRRLSPVIGFPAITVPAGFTAEGLPVGLELMAREFAEPTLFKLAYAFEQGTRHRRPPKTTPPLGDPSSEGRSPMTDEHRRFHVLGDFRLESGAVLPNAKVAYATFGALNAQRDNAILLPSWYGSDHHGYDFLIGAGRALDPAKYFLVATEMFANGFSSSPSNTPPPFDRAHFPAIAQRDNVEAAARVLAELGVTHVRAVVGFSMGAQQAFQWAVSHPDFVDAIVPYCGTAKTYPHGVVRLDGAISALTADAEFKGGDYTSPP